MHVFWQSVIKPLLDAVSPSVIVEVGAAEGYNTRNLVQYARDHDCALHVIDPKPLFDAEEMVDARGESFVLHRTQSLNALPEIAEPDVVLVDGDHNWYTVYHELQLLEKGARRAERPFPTVVLHDVDWPYGRRDLYYEPDAIPPAYRLPHRRQGLLPDSPEPVAEGGLNPHLWNAIYTHDLRNGVRTAVEDFVAESAGELVLHDVPGEHGLAILTPDPAGRKRAAPLRRELARLGSTQFLVERGRQVEELRIRSVIAAKEEKRKRQESEVRLKRMVTDAADARAEAESESERIRAELDSAEQKGAAVDRELNDLRIELEGVAAALDEAEDAAAALREQTKHLESQREALGKELDARAEELESARGAAAEAERERERLQDRLAQAETEAATLREQVADLQREAEAAGAQLEVGAVALHETEERAALAERERSALSAELDARAEELESARGAAAEAERERERLQDRLAQAETGAAALREQVAKLQPEHEAMAKVITTTADALRHAERRQGAAELARDQAQARLAQVEQRARTLADARAQAEERAHALAEELDGKLRETASSAAARSALLGFVERQDRDRQALLDALESHIERAAASRSFRHGHRFFRMLAVLSFRRPKGRGTALDLAADVALRLKELERETAPAPPPAGETGGPSGEAGGPAGGQDPPATPPGTNGAAPHTPAKAGATRAPADAEPGFGVERALRASFSDRYAALRETSGLRSPSEQELSGPLARDGRGILVGPSSVRLAGFTADVVVCVKDALEDVRRCLWSVLHFTDRPLRLIVVDDGSLPPTRSLLEETAARETSIELLRNEGPDHGYTRAANIGLRASTADYVVLLNSDTIVTPGWLDQLIACGESNEAIGVVGPLSNAATHQSVPRVKDDGGWAVNDLPAWLTPATMAFLVTELSERRSPRFPFVNGFCYAIKRQALDRVGLLDEDLFGSGYCEENDLSVRLHDAGFALAVADDSYVFHAKSRSYAPEGRKAIAGENYKRFLEKHGERRVASMLEQLEREDGLALVRRSMTEATADPKATVEAFRAARPRPLEVLFVLHGMSEGSSGGGHSIYQEVSGMRRLGIPARIAIGTKGLEHARAAYPDADGLFVPFRDSGELERIATGADVIVATHFTTVALVEGLRQTRSGFLPAYYVQDYEPFFLDAASPRMVEAAASYTALPDLLLFAKTHWLCNVVGSAHGVHVAKVEPSIDEELFNLDGRQRDESGRVRVTAMIRPRTPRRQPGATLAVLRELQRQRPDAVRVTTFGCGDAQLEAISGGSATGEHRGILTRAEVADLLRASDVFLDLSTYQAFGRTALEAMACGCSAVVPATGGVHEFARDSENAVLVDSLRPEQVVGELVDLVDDRKRLSCLQAGAGATAGGYSVLKASLAQYALFEREYRSRITHGGNGARAEAPFPMAPAPTTGGPAGGDRAGRH